MRRNGTIIRNIIIGVVAAGASLIIWAAIKAFKRN